MKLKKFGRWIWKWRWPLGAWLWLWVITTISIDQAGFWQGAYVVGAFIMGFCYMDEKRKVRAKEARDDRQESDSTATTG